MKILYKQQTSHSLSTIFIDKSINYNNKVNININVVSIALDHQSTEKDTINKK